MELNVINQIKELVERSKKLFIVAHRNPDGDAIGSVLALRRFMQDKGCEVKVAFPSEYPNFFSWVKDVDQILIYDQSREKCKKAIEWADAFFVLDLNSLTRLDEMGDLIASKSAPKILIDHHLYPDASAFDIMISDTSASSTCELVYELINEWDPTLIDAQMGVYLYLGILTDTGTFSYSTSTRLFRNVSTLLEQSNIDHIGLQTKLNNNIPEKNLRLLGHCLSQRMELLPELRTGIIWLNQKDFSHWRIRRGDTEGIVNYILKMEGYDVAAFFTDQRSIIKMSFRSIGDISVEEIAKKHFSGGGHKNAAGGHSFTTLEETIKKFKEVLPSHII